MISHIFAPGAKLTQIQLRSSSEANFALQNEINFALKQNLRMTLHKATKAEFTWKLKGLRSSAVNITFAFCELTECKKA